MNFPEFETVQDKTLSECRAMSGTKGKEYANSEDRFANFNRLAERLHLDRKLVWLVYFTKHMDAIESFVHLNRTLSEENIHGRIVDAITYLTLLDGMIGEEAQK